MLEITTHDDCIAKEADFYLCKQERMALLPDVHQHIVHSEMALNIDESSHAQHHHKV